MIPGPTVIRKCSGCSGLIEQDTLMSGNTLGATCWTDGKMDAPMMPDQPELVKCLHCKALVWIEDLEEVGELLDHPETNTEFPEVKPYKELKLKDYLGYLAAGGCLADQERDIRIWGWWAGNDKRRTDAENKNPMIRNEIVNLETLIHLLDEGDPSDLLMKAEAYRELGRFDEAKAVLLKGDPSFAPEANDVIWQLCGQRDVFVRELK